ncbi:hypothetical protein AM493_05470 [Flavobacterium akiainvivens]|uniref:Uncharacterized protein n=1 Tax=Flavobacterium akiainvivens TaxID=1202724 RepID=A0A0M8MBY1_9FLAO|nr:hypothetical protein [Flavobacterium akiainvivens]KOS05544.1 hypothetical protein AM493_05470 [Flavobacterium akiainvivens]SFQ33958.1 hypothetical protein SAMN05444144_103129 [Flavobacterium akiainvivens]
MLKKILLSLLISSAGYSQIKYVPVMINQCTGNKDYEYFQLTDWKGETYTNTDNDTITLPEPGVYQMHHDFKEAPVSIKFNDTEIRTDTFYTTKLNLSIYISNPPFSEYFSCGEKANGLVTDYYFNGTIRQTGTFKNGQLDGFLKMYSNLGKLQEMHFKHKKKWSKTEYYTNGTIKSYTGNINGFEHNEYYNDGKLSLHETSSGFMIYNSTGTINQTLRWKKKKRITFFKEDKRILYQYTLSRYKGSGYKTQETVFESYTEPYFFQKGSIDEMQLISEIKRVTFYSNNKEVVRIEPEDDSFKATVTITLVKTRHKEKITSKDELLATLIKYTKASN